jgi:hypothetical protein
MADFQEEEIRIVRWPAKVKTYRVLLSPQMPCNIIERAFVEALKRPWTRSDGGINYDFSQHASPPLGRCEITWGWKGATATQSDIFIVVEEVKGTPCKVILGPTVGQLPFAESWEAGSHVYTFAMARQTRGNLFFTMPVMAKLADNEIIDQQRDRNERANLATQRKGEERALDDARTRERWEKKRRDQQENNRRA